MKTMHWHTPVFLFVSFAAALAAISYPYKAAPEREKQIREGYPLFKSEMTPAQMKKVLGEPDSVTPLYEPKVKGGKQMGYTYWYLIQQNKESGSLNEMGQIGVRVRTVLDGRIIAVETFGMGKDDIDEGSRKNAEHREKLKTVTIADGISKSEAEVIAECYFDKNVGCGAFTGIRDGGDRWIVDGKYDFEGKQVQGFYIEKRTGKVTSPIGPSYDDPLKIFP